MPKYKIGTEVEFVHPHGKEDCACYTQSIEALDWESAVRLGKTQTPDLVRQEFGAGCVIQRVADCEANEED